jgi:hypothetical protein
VLAEPAQPAVGGDVQPVHHPARPDGTDPRQGFEHVDHLGVGDHVIRFGQLQDFGQRSLTRA